MNDGEEFVCTTAEWLQYGDSIHQLTRIKRVQLTTPPGVVVCGWGDGDTSFGFAETDSGPVPEEEFQVAMPRHSDMYDRHNLIVACLKCRYPGIEFTFPEVKLL
jgi:hypothetical protein